MTARSGMNELIDELRSMGAAGASDYTVGATTYWSDDQLQTILDRYRTEIIYHAVDGVYEYDTGGSVVYKRYPLGYENLEKTTGGTSVFFLQDGDFDYVGTASYTVDYRRGLVTFGQDTAGSTYWLTAYSYDLNKAALDVWRKKLAYYAAAYDVRTDNQQLTRSQLMAHAQQMVNYYAGQSMFTINMARGDEW